MAKRMTGGFKFRSQYYWHDGTVDHQTRDGRRIKLRRLYTLCPACGVGFRMLTTATAIRTRNLRRRCDGCKRQGVPVEYRAAPKTGRKRPAGVVKGNPRSGRLGAPKSAPRVQIGRVVASTAEAPRSTAPTAAGPSTPRWLTRPMLRRPAGPKIHGSALVDAVELGAVLGMLVQPSDCCGEAEGDA